MPPAISRRQFLGLGVATLAGLPTMTPAATVGAPVTVLHLTDIHIRPEHDAPARCRNFLRAIRRRHPGISLVVNTGDSIYAADRPGVTRERVEEQWDLWDSVVMKELKGLPKLHAIGNHDPWTDAPDGDPMSGVPYACKRLGLPGAYYQSRHAGWEILTLDNSAYRLDRAQQKWLLRALDRMPMNAPLMVVSHLPLLSAAGDREGGTMSGAKSLVTRLAARRSPVISLSGHLHLRSDESKGNFHCHCNGSLSGSWWEPGRRNDGSYKGVPMGYAIVKLWPDGRSESTYHSLRG